MKNAIRISVKTPCFEKFENFKETPNGGFCGSCQKEVIDFTTMTSEELFLNFSNITDQTCGRFTSAQLKTYESTMHTKTSFVSRGLAILSFSLLSLCAVSKLQAQDVANHEPSIKTEVSITQQEIIMGDVIVEKYTVKGTVLDEENLPLAGVNVVLKGSAEGTVTDFDGKFEFPRALDVDDTLVFSYISYQPKEYVIEASDSNIIDITINFNNSDIFLMGAVEVDGVYASKRNIFQKFIGLFK